MPGVTNGHHRWNDSASQMSDFDSYPRRGVSPHRTDIDMKGSLKPSYSNGYSSDQQSDSNDDGPVYILEHLATFSVGPQYGLMSPKDGLRRLFQMEKTNGIWTQKMQLRLEKSWVVIIDYENGDVVERFPMNLICDPTSFTSNDPRELYNNILVFIVQEDPKGKMQNNSEMHIFQCVRVSAQEVVDELKRFISGKWKPGYRNSESYSIPPPPSNPPPDPPVNGGGIPGVSVKEQVSMFNAAAAAAAATSGEAPQRLVSGHQRLDRIERSEQIRPNYARESNDETSSTSSDRYEKDVAILNHCFDDIERFIARLQHAAAAFRELERRYKSRKNKKKDLGDGLLSMRAKPPPEREFVDILQKFKLSFNLLAKLKSHIHDPNAPELVHFLFTPLALIVDAARESGYGPNLAHKVVSPLLTRDAIELLSNCCTSKESDLWHSLGDPWFIPREQWKGYQGNYHPVFSDGWAPDYPFTEERERAELTASAAASAAQKHRRDEIRRAQEEERESHYGSEYYYGSDHGGPSDRPRSPEHPHHHTQAYENRQYESRHMEMSRRDILLERGGAGTPPLEHDYREPHHDRDIRSDFSADSMERVSRPLDMQQQFERQQKQWLEELKARGAKIVQVMYPRTANNEKELTVVRGEFLEVLDDTRKWWKARNARGQEAHVPHTIVTPYQGMAPMDDDIFNNPLYATRGGSYYSPSDSPGAHDRSMDSNLGRPSGSPRDRDARPPPIPPPAPAPAEWVRRERQGKKDSLTNNSSSSHKQDSSFQRSPNLSISSNSSLRANDRALIKEIQNGMRVASPSGSLASSDIDTEVSEPPPPPPMPPENHAPVPSRRSSQAMDSPQKVQRDQLHEELKIRVSLGAKSHKKWGNAPVLNNLHPIYLTPETTPAEVQMWLEVKGFSDRTREMFKTFTGKMMFSLTRHQLETHLGHEEGSRLHSNLLVQRNLCGYKTITSHELQSILEERRKKVDLQNSSRSIQGDRDSNPSNVVDIGRI